MKIAPVSPAVPPNLAEILNDLRNAALELLNPTQPSQVVSIASDKLPPASAWNGCVVRLSDLNILACSDGSVWTRQDTGAPL